MDYATRPQLSAEQQVTASELVRHFGPWQDRAARAPVYIHHRGRLRLVLLSLELMNSLCTPHAQSTHDPQAGVPALTDLLDDAIVLFDTGGRIQHANTAARTRFGAGAQLDQPARQLSSASGPFLADAVARVLDSGTAETLDLVPDRYPGRRMHARLDPFGDGCLLVARDATAGEEARARTAELRALERAIEVSNVAARARINPRGYLIEPEPALARMTGTTPEQLASARFLTLVAVADRARVGDMIDYAYANNAAVGTRAHLLVRGATAVPSAIGLAPVERAGRVEEISVLLTPAAT
jgi:PAS domain-containing protein